MRALPIRTKRFHKLEILYFVVLVVAILILTSLTLPA